ncbi:MAG: ABC transporter permease [Trueperaceae bacterium]
MNALFRAWRRDPVTPLGGAIGIAALVSLGPWRPGWLLFKPNRLVGGETFGAFEVEPVLAWALVATWIALIVVGTLVAAGRGSERAGRGTERAAREPSGSAAADGQVGKVLAVAAAILVAAAFVIALLAVGRGATALVDGAPPSARVSLSGGVWLTVLAFYVAAFGVSADLPRRWAGVVAVGTLVAVGWVAQSGALADLGLARELVSQGSDFRAEIGRHMALALTSLLVATFVGIPAAVASARNDAVARWVLPTVAFFQTLPSLALFGLLLAPLARLGRAVTVGEALRFGLLLVPAVLVWVFARRFRASGTKGFAWLVAGLAALAPLLLLAMVVAVVVNEALTAVFGGGAVPSWPGLSSSLAALGVRGIGSAPALIALTLYALLPIVRNTYTGLRGVPDAAIEAGTGMGMSQGQLLRRVEWPLAMPLVIEGMRAASVLIIGITTVAYLIGAGGLGVFIQRGIDQVVPDLVLLGAVPVILLALAADAVLRGVRTLLTPRGLRGESA